MRFLSICSGIEAASVASEPLGWNPLAFSEIEPFPRAVLQHHYPEVPLHGDFTELKDQPWIVDADLLCGGTPCQAFSVAGLRKSLSDDRGNLSLQFIHLADAIDNLRSAAGRQPAYIVWENVPGVLSTNDNAFGAFLGGLCGRDAAIPEPEGGWTSSGVVDGPTRVAAWRTMDAQFFGVAQRRRRVFVLAHGGAGKWAAADALLPITEGMSGNPPPRRVAGQRPAPTIASRPSGGGGLGTDFDLDGGLIPEVASPLTAGNSVSGGGAMPGTSADDAGGLLIPEVTGPLVTRSTPKGHGAAGVNDQEVFSGHLIPEVANPLTARMHKGVNTTMDEGQTMVPVAFKMRAGNGMTDGSRGAKPGQSGGVGYLGQDECAFTLSTTEDQMVAVPFDCADTVTSKWAKGAEALQQDAKSGGNCIPVGSMAVRRLTPMECERLQGFPDRYTEIPWRGKPAELCPDGPRYKALGNSWAVPNMRWIFRRIQKVDDIKKRLSHAD